jgi:hypothetical protein
VIFNTQPEFDVTLTPRLSATRGNTMPFQSSESIFQSLLLVAMCIAAGAFLSTQSGINARLSAGLQSPLMAALISFGTGTVVLLLATLLLQELKPLAGAANLPWWVWTGGIPGAFIVATIEGVLNYLTRPVMSKKSARQGVERREWRALYQFNNADGGIFDHNPSG